MRRGGHPPFANIAPFASFARNSLRKPVTVHGRAGLRAGIPQFHRKQRRTSKTNVIHYASNNYTLLYGIRIYLFVTTMINFSLTMMKFSATFYLFTTTFYLCGATLNKFAHTFAQSDGKKHQSERKFHHCGVKKIESGREKIGWRRKKIDQCLAWLRRLVAPLLGGSTSTPQRGRANQLARQFEFSYKYRVSHHSEVLTI